MIVVKNGLDMLLRNYSPPIKSKVGGVSTIFMMSGCVNSIGEILWVLTDVVLRGLSMENLSSPWRMPRRRGEIGELVELVM